MVTVKLFRVRRRDTQVTALAKHAETPALSPPRPRLSVLCVRICRSFSLSLSHCVLKFLGL